MAYDEGLAERIRGELEGTPGLTERKMFGGLAFMVAGNLAVGVVGEDMIVRVGPDATEEALARPGARVFDMTGRAMKGWVVVGADALEDDDAFAAWVDQALAFVRTLPPK